MTRRALVLAAVLAGTVSNAGAQVERGEAPHACRLPASPEALGLPRLAARVAPAVARARALGPDCDPATEGARFEITYTGFPAGAEAAFQAAADVWACRLRSDQPVRVDATWGPLDQGTLGSAGPVLFRNFEGAPARGVWYPAALADELAGRDLGDGAADIEAVFNSQFPGWHTGSGPPPEGTYDLTTVVLHELAHGLGFIGSLDVEDGRGTVGPEPGGPFSYDLFTRAASGTPILDPDVFPDGSVALAVALQRQVTFDGRAARQAEGGPLPLFAPPRWIPGASFSHLDEDTYPPGTPNGLMTPYISRNEFVTEPGPAVCAVLADVGWTLAGDCARLVGALPALATGVRVERRGSNPFAGRTTLRVTAEPAATLDARLLDVRGRRVAPLGRRVLVAGQPWDLVVDGGGLASGVYFVQIRGGGEPLVVPLTVIR